MQYVTGMQALNIPCNLNTSGDWHGCCMDWAHPNLRESVGSFFGDYGIEGPKKIPEHEELFFVANHIRALLDLLYEQKFIDARGMRNDYICDEEADREIFSKIMQMRKLPYWEEINHFMEREYFSRWADFLKEQKNAAGL